MKLKDQVAIVTGAGRNIGEEIAKLFAAEGAKVAIVDIDQSRGERVAGAIKASGGEAALFQADVSKGGAVEKLVKDMVARFGRIDILVNNVAISDNKHIFDITEEEWDRVMAVTLKSQFLMGKHVGQQMAAQGAGGRIVNIGSTSGFTDAAAPSPIRPPRAAWPISPAPWRCSSRRTRSASTPSCRTRSARRSARTSSTRRGRCPTWRSGRPAGGSRQGRAVPGQRRFVVRLRRQAVRRRRRVGDGSVVTCVMAGFRRHP